MLTQTLFFCWLEAITVFILISLAVFGYSAQIGYFLSTIQNHSKIKQTDLTLNSYSQIAVGLGFFLSLITLTGMAGAYTTPFQTAWVGLGIYFLFKRWRYLPEITLPAKRDWLWLLPPLCYWLCRFFSCGIPQQHSDPLYYHLSAAKHWAEIGQIKLVLEHPSFAQTGIWEALYGIPQLWLGLTGTHAHVKSQLVGQWLHFFWGQIGSAIAASIVLRLLITTAATKKHILQQAGMSKLQPGLALFWGWLLVSLPSFEWTGCLAKNEYVVLVFILCAVAEMLRRNFFISGLLAGFAFATKSVTAWFVLGLVIFMPSRRYLLGFSLGALPYLLRNLIWTGNPVFPALDQKLGPGWLSEAWKGHFAASGGFMQWNPAMFEWLWTKMLEGGLPKVLILLGIISWISVIAVSQLRAKYLLYLPKRAGYWLVFLLVELLATILILKPGADGRYAHFLAVVLLLILCTPLIGQLIIIRNKFLKPLAVVLTLSLVLLVNIPFDVLYKIPHQYWFKPSAQYVEQFHLHQTAKTWVNKNTDSSAKIFFTEKISFYIDRPFEAVGEMKSWEDRLKQIRSPEELFYLLKKQGYRYAYFSTETAYPPVLRPYWDKLMEYRKWATYQSDFALVFDLEELILQDFEG